MRRCGAKIHPGVRPAYHIYWSCVVWDAVRLEHSLSPPVPPFLDCTARAPGWEARTTTASSVAAQRHTALAQELDRLVRVLAADGALRVIVYGSFARGDVGPASDLDLLVVVPPDGATFVERLGRLYAVTRPVLPCDMLAYTEDELAALAAGTELVAGALQEGRVVYARSPSPGV